MKPRTAGFSELSKNAIADCIALGHLDSFAATSEKQKQVLRFAQDDKILVHLTRIQNWLTRI
jgi:hypothetical protein